MNSEVKTTGKGGLKLTFPLIFLILIIMSTIGIYGYDYYLQGKSTELNKKIKLIDKEILDLNKDKNIQVYNLIKKNKPILDKMNSYSEITRFINSIAYIEKEYGLKSTGFNYSNGIVTTKITTNSTKTFTPYLAVSQFIKNYREEKNAVFTIPFINKIVGFRKIEFSLKLKVKDNLKKNNIPNKK